MISEGSLLFRPSPSQNSPPSLLAYCQLLEVVNGQAALIEEKNGLIERLQKELREVRVRQKKSRQKQLFQLFKNKYELQYKNRNDFQKQVLLFIRNIQPKLTNIERTLDKCKASDFTDTSLHQSSQINHKFLFSSQFSEIPKAPDALFASPLQLGQITTVNCPDLFSQLSTRIQYIQSVVQMVFLKIDKYAFEHQNMHKIMRAQKRELEAEVKALHHNLTQQIKQKDQLKKILEKTENERNRRVEGMKAPTVDKLVGFQKEVLAQQVLRMTICINELRKANRQKQLQLLAFKEQQKARYTHFLQKLKEKKQKMAKIS